MKSVGIITMHRPISFGSALQSYALQKKISDLGYRVELIDYQYPNSIHGFKKKGVRDLIRGIISFCLNALFGFPNIKKKKRFSRFYINNYNLSQYYPTADSLKQSPPNYDIFCTGSDQVWNALFTKKDTSFLLSFVGKNQKKISYASSFAINYVPDNVKEEYVKFLSDYQSISVREKSGVKLVKDLTGKDASWVCDPTVLLPKEEWDIVADQSEIRIKEHYILVFMLCYSFNPYPEVQNIIDSIQSKLNLPVIYLDGGKGDYKRKNSRVIKNAGPSEFVELIRHADYVISASFHGVVFASLYNRPFSAIVKHDNPDSRILSYLSKVNMVNSAAFYDTKDVNVSMPHTLEAIDDFRKESLDYLNNSLSN